MRVDSDVAEALRRAGRRVVYHLIRAGIEGLKAVEAVVDELGSVGRESEPRDEPVERVEVE